MTLNLTLLVVMGVMFAAGIYLLLERSLTRVLLGIILISNGVNLLLLQTAGRAGLAPLVRDGVGADEYFDPLPQALLLTAIVIAFALVSFVLALIYRSWVLARQDEVTEDEEDQRVAEQPTYDPEEDADVEAETSEFIDEDREVLNPREGTDDPSTSGLADAQTDTRQAGRVSQGSDQNPGADNPGSTSEGRG